MKFARDCKSADTRWTIDADCKATFGEAESGGNQWLIVDIKDGAGPTNNRRLWYATAADRDADMEAAVAAYALAGRKFTLVNATGAKPMTDAIKQYLDKHRDTIFTVALVLILDHFFLGGALRDRTKSILESFLTSAENKIKSLNAPKAVPPQAGPAAQTSTEAA